MSSGTTPTWRSRAGTGFGTDASEGTMGQISSRTPEPVLDLSGSMQPQMLTGKGSGEDEPETGTSSSSRLGAGAPQGWWTSALASELMYCTVSAGTTLFNKDVLGLISLQPLRWETARVWLPVNLIFVAMNITGFYALQDVGVGMFTVLKNLSNLMTIVGDYLIFNITYSWQVWACLTLMITSAVLGGATDMSFNARGYMWQLVNCVFTAAYSLYLSSVIKKLSRQHHGKPPLSEISMVYYNNLLSVPPLALLSIVSGEPALLRGAHQVRDPKFQIVAIMGGMMGFGVSFASIWCMSRTSATIYSLTGSLNKVVVAVCGMWYFHESVGLVNMASIAAGLVAGFLFVFAKIPYSADPKGSSADLTSLSTASDEDRQPTTAVPAHSISLPLLGTGKSHSLSGGITSPRLKTIA